MSVTISNDAAPTLSVLLPVYNAGPYLREAVESVLGQNFQDFELLTIDDGSTDGSLRILREYEAKDKRVSVLSRENQGVVRTANELLKLARGCYWARMDADDICMPRRFESQVAFLDASPNHVVVGGWVELINAGGLPIRVHSNPCSHDDIERAQLEGRTSICHPTAMFRKEATLRAGCYRPEFETAEDLDLYLRLAEIGRVGNIPRVVLRYRLHSSSISEAQGQRQYVAMRRACEAAWQRRGISGHHGVDQHWRPGADNASRHKFAVRNGWVAWNNGHRKTWRSFASEALRLRPFSLSSWRLLIFGSLKRPEG